MKKLWDPRFETGFVLVRFVADCPLSFFKIGISRDTEKRTNYRYSRSAFTFYASMKSKGNI
jgi:hypothetical protein